MGIFSPVFYFLAARQIVMMLKMVQVAKAEVIMVASWSGCLFTLSITINETGNIDLDADKLK